MVILVSSKLVFATSHFRRGKYGCDMALEMRIIGDSDSTLAPFRGNRHGTVSIEPVMSFARGPCCNYSSSQ